MSTTLSIFHLLNFPERHDVRAALRIVDLEAVHGNLGSVLVDNIPDNPLCDAYLLTVPGAVAPRLCRTLCLITSQNATAPKPPV